MSENFSFKFTSLADIAKAMIDTYPNCLIHYVGAADPGINILCVKDTGLYLRDVRPYLDDSIGLCYGANQDTIHFYYV